MCLEGQQSEKLYENLEPENKYQLTRPPISGHYIYRPLASWSHLS